MDDLIQVSNFEIPELLDAPEEMAGRACGCNIYSTRYEEPIDLLLIALANKARETHTGAAVVQRGFVSDRVIGFDINQAGALRLIS